MSKAKRITISLVMLGAFFLMLGVFANQALPSRTVKIEQPLEHVCCKMTANGDYRCKHRYC